LIPNTEFALSDAEFNGVRERVYRLAGISLSDAKRSMVVSRLGKLVRRQKFRSFTAYLEFLDSEGGQHLQDFVNALTTNLTRFWREEHHFAHLEEYVGGLVEHEPRHSSDGRPRLRIWSAGCSTGQEAYTVALTLLASYPALKRWDFKVLATDIDTSVLAKAATGVYPQSELQGLSPERAVLFERGDDDTIRVPDAVRSLVSFKPLNLLSPWPMQGKFDAIFCRNVTIYFDRETQGALFARLGDVLVPEGYLYIGHSENLGSSGDRFRLVGRTVYQPRPVASARSAA
jgi:chemotaxis protein methyltransferase CheR